MLIDVESLNYPLYTSLLAITFLCGIIVVRKKLWNLFDPLILTLFFISFNVVNVVYFNLISVYQSDYVYYIVISYILFLFGLRVNFINKIKFRRNPQKNRTYVGPTKSATKYLFWISILFSAISAAFVFYNVGFGILTQTVSPDIKNMITLNGYGIFKYISWAGNLLLLPIIAHAYFIHKLKLITYIGILWFLITSILFNFSKAGFFFLMFDLGIVLYYFEINLQYQIIRYKKIIMISVIGLIPAYIVLSNYQSITGIPIYNYLIIRFIDTGGGTYNYFVLEGMHAFDGWDFLTRLTYYFDTILSVFRIKSWADPNIMATMTQYLTGSYQPGFGQNPYLFLDGHFLFGWFGIIYSYALGLLINYIRNIKADIISFFILIKMFIPIVADPDMTQAYIVSVMLLIPFILFIMLAAKSFNNSILRRYTLN